MAHIMVIDDEQGMRDLLSGELEAHGFSVATAGNGAEALEKIKDGKFELVISDCNMPKMDGLQTLEAIKSINAGIEVLLITGLGTVGKAVSAMKNGAYDFIEKPFGMDVLMALVEKALEKRELKGMVFDLQEANRKLEAAQHQLIQAEKLAVVGQLAASVAHELNNPLTGVLGFAQVLLEEDGLSLSQREDLTNICKESQRCRVIIQNLLKFSRKKESKMETLRVLPLLEDTLNLVRHDFQNSLVEIVREFPDASPTVYGDFVQLQQVFLNILTNAKQAMEKCELKKITIRVLHIPDKVTLGFSDTGPGISRENLDKIFEPFFTTKPTGQGTGLGLSISNGIIKDHGGAIRVESQEGVGATFWIDLPLPCH